MNNHVSLHQKTTANVTYLSLSLSLSKENLVSSPAFPHGGGSQQCQKSSLPWWGDFFPSLSAPNCFYIHMINLCTVLLGAFVMIKGTIIFFLFFLDCFLLSPSTVIEENLFVKSSAQRWQGWVRNSGFLLQNNQSVPWLAVCGVTMHCASKASTQALNLFVNFSSS